MPNKETIRKTAYDKENTRRYFLKLNKNTDTDIIEALDTHGGYQTYIKRLIRQDIQRHAHDDEEQNAQ